MFETEKKKDAFMTSIFHNRMWIFSYRFDQLTQALIKEKNGSYYSCRKKRNTLDEGVSIYHINGI
ncbi:hypothetical protein [Thalassobacillus cyri]|uniref:hypothetical protein n=1 Tax=Thalassobacillus cyri TaxID=571932 RepID=UPI00115FBEDA|nr:hypothetical protein [Thalassobacillus cyri]